MNSGTEVRRGITLKEKLAYFIGECGSCGMFYYLTKNSSMLYSVTDVIDTYVYRALRVTGDVGMSTAIGLCQSVVGFIILVVANKITKKINGEGTLF